MRSFRVTLFAIVGIVLMAPSTIANSAGGACNTPSVNDINYLVFWPPLPGATPETLGESIRAFAAKLGSTGDGKTRQLGFGALIPAFMANEAAIPPAVALMFEIARRTNVAVHFNVDDHITWDERPDLWNWYDPGQKGYNPSNKSNVEWYDWEGTANKRRYFSPAGASSQSPHMCYNSPVVQKEIRRIVLNVLGPALKTGIDRLKKEGKEYLFGGITVGAEAGFDDYSNIPNVSQLPRRGDPMQMQLVRMLRQAATLMDQDKAPHSRLGYCSLTNAGYSKAKPPADINQALAEINQKFIAFWDNQFVDAGIPCSQIYTHVAAAPLQDENNNAPLWIVFNPYARPGWSTYPQGMLENGFKPLYDQLEKNGNPAWGGVEANASLGNSGAAAKFNWESYLAAHYNHGAKIVGINIGASDPALVSHLSKGAFGADAIAAYIKFLTGGALVEQ